MDARALQGTWTIRDWSDAVEGEISFDGSRAQTSWGDVTLNGTWALVASDGATHQIELSVEGAVVAGVEEVYGDFSRVPLTLVFSSPDRTYALEENGTWTVWDRLAAP